MAHRGKVPLIESGSLRGSMLIGALVTAVIAAGTVSTCSEIRSADGFMREIMLSEAQMVAGAIDPWRIARLTGTLDDLRSADYLYIRSQIVRIRNANPRYRYLYLMGKNPGGHPFFFMGTAPADSPDYSPPGQEYFEKAPFLEKIFATSVEQVSEPVTDRWGTWISALVPIPHPEQGGLMAVLGMDFDAGDWNRMVIRRAMTPVGLTMFALILLIVFVVQFRYRQSRREKEIFRAANEELSTANEELRAAMEELEASNEEFEAQNNELLRSEEAMRASEAELLAIFNGTYDAMIIHDLKGNILEVNDRMLEMYRVNRARALAVTVYDLVAPESDIEAGKTIWDRVAEGEYTLTEWKARRPEDGSVFDAEVGLKRLMRRGSYVILAVVRDMTFRKEAETALRESLNEKNFLIREIHHRVKNNMQIISSLLNMQSNAVAEPTANQALKDAMGRIHSMASIHERIYGTDNFSRIDMAAYIDELSRDLVQLYSRASGDIQLTHHLQPVFMGIDRAIPCGLLINEILTNSIKHGCSGTEACRIDLGVEESDGWITIVIADYGPGMEPELFNAERKTSMGMQIIEALARQISATVTLEVNHGTRFTIHVSSEP